MIRTPAFSLLPALGLVLALAPASFGQIVVGFQDFDGGDINLISGFDVADNVDGGLGDWFGIGNIVNWPQGFPSQSPANPGIPFGLVDDSVINISGGTFDATGNFPGDTEGIFGQNRDFSDSFFGISDIRDEAPLTASWTFDISSAFQNGTLDLEIAMGQQSNGDSFGGLPDTTDMVWEYSIDGGAFETAIQLAATNGDLQGFVYRTMDGGNLTNSNSVMEATGPNGVEKIESDTGLVATNTILNKTPSAGAGAGLMDVFRTRLNFTGGSQIEIRLTANEMSFEAFAFDNIALSSTAIPEPGTASLLLIGMVGWISRRRRR